MAFRDLRQFVAFLEGRGQLKRVGALVSPRLEIAAITDRVCKGPPEQNLALLFENVEGSGMPVLTNAFGSASRMAWALGAESLDELSRRMEKFLQLELPRGVAGHLQRLGDLLRIVKARPVLVGDPPCQEVVETRNPTLAEVPVLQCWPGDAGPYITLPLVITRDPVTGRRNVGMYRLQVFDERTLGVHWQRHKGGREHEDAARGAGQERLEVAVALGGDPATIYAATAPLPSGVDELLFAGWLRGEGVELARCLTVDLEVPAHAEIVLEGYIDLSERRLEGPFGDHTGYYSLPEYYPVMHLTAVTRRADAIYPATVVGRPPMEDYWLGKATERLFLPLLRLVLPEIVDINMPAAGVFHNLVIVSIRKRFPGQVRRVLYGLWGLGLMMLAKMIVVVDEGVNVHDLAEVAWRVGNNVDPSRDVVIVQGPLDDLDHASLRPGFGGKMGIDATAKDARDGFERPWPQEVITSPEVAARVLERWREYGFS